MSYGRLARIAAKLRLRLAVAVRVLRALEDTYSRSSIKVSFSQAGEDLIVWFLLQQLGIARPVYVDIGAHHPEYLSNTALFHLLGSSGLNIEPDPDLFRAFPRVRPKDINLNVGIGPEAGRMTFFRMADPALSTFNRAEAHARSHDDGIAIRDELIVRVERIADILDTHGVHPDFLSVDVEGHDMEVLQSFDFERHRPAVICVETISFSLSGQGRKNKEIDELLTARGFRAYADTYVNTIYVDVRRFDASTRL